MTLLGIVPCYSEAKNMKPQPRKEPFMSTLKPETADRNTIQCPHCGASIDLEAALSNRVRAEIEDGLRADFQRKLAEVERRDAELKQMKETLAADRATLDEQVRDRLEAEKKKLLKTAEQKARDSLAVELKDLQSRVNERDAQLKVAQEQELDLRKKARELETREENLKLELERKLDEERVTLRKQIEERLTGEHAAREQKKDQTIADLKHALENAQRKAEQGSTERQGELLEDALEARLCARFPRDRIEPIKKGVRGADVRQVVLNDSGIECGTILWEAKNAQKWSDAWVDKLNADLNENSAQLGIIVTNALPPDIDRVGQRGNIWISEVAASLGLAAALRTLLIDLTFERAAVVNRGSKMELLYAYLSSADFRRRIQTIADNYAAMKDQIARERRAFEKQWRERERMIDGVLVNTSQLYGDLRGIMGGGSLPDIDAFSLEAHAPAALTDGATED